MPASRESTREAVQPPQAADVPVKAGVPPAPHAPRVLLQVPDLSTSTGERRPAAPSERTTATAAVAAPPAAPSASPGHSAPATHSPPSTHAATPAPHIVPPVRPHFEPASAGVDRAPAKQPPRKQSWGNLVLFALLGTAIGLLAAIVATRARREDPPPPPPPAWQSPAGQARSSGEAPALNFENGLPATEEMNVDLRLPGGGAGVPPPQVDVPSPPSPEGAGAATTGPRPHVAQRPRPAAKDGVQLTGTIETLPPEADDERAGSSLH